MNDFQAEPAQLQQEMLAAFTTVMGSGRYILGSQVETFERAWARTSGTTHCVAVANGLDAIEIGLRAAGIRSGDEVITTPMTAFATVVGILRAGATPVLADIDPLTANLDPESVARCITPRTRAILVVHLYGQMAPMAALLDLAARYRIALFEDCAQAHLARDTVGQAGSLGVFGAWSFYPTKNLGAIGDAGAITTSSDEVAASARTLRNYGQSNRYQHDVVGMNSRMDELQAALLNVRLPYLAGWTARRREIATAYARGIENSRVRVLASPACETAHVHHLFVVTTSHRAALVGHLEARGVASLMHYPIAAHRQTPTLDLARDPRGLAQAEIHAEQCLTLPCHPALSEADVAAVIAAVNSFV